MLVDGYIIKVDYPVQRKLAAKVNKIGANINQVCKQINETGRAFAKDVMELKSRMKNIFLAYAPKLRVPRIFIFSSMRFFSFSSTHSLSWIALFLSAILFSFFQNWRVWDFLGRRVQAAGLHWHKYALRHRKRHDERYVYKRVQTAFASLLPALLKKYIIKTSLIPPNFFKR